METSGCKIMNVAEMCGYAAWCCCTRLSTSIFPIQCLVYHIRSIKTGYLVLRLIHFVTTFRNTFRQQLHNGRLQSFHITQNKSLLPSTTMKIITAHCVIALQFNDLMSEYIMQRTVLFWLHGAFRKYEFYIRCNRFVIQCVMLWLRRFMFLV